MTDLSKRDLRKRLRHLEEKVYPDSQDTPLIEFGSEDDPLPPSYHESLKAENAEVGNITDDERTSDPGANEKLTTKLQNQVVGAGHRSWPMQNRALLLASMPRNRSKARISFSHDGTESEDYNDVFPLYRDRGIPWSDNLTASRIGGSGKVTKSQVDEMVSHGMEVGAYVHDEDDQSLDAISSEQNGDEKVLETILYNRRDLEDEGYIVARHKARQGDDINKGDIGTPKAHAIRSAFLASGAGGIRAGPADHITAPSMHVYGTQVWNIQGKTEAEIKSIIDKTIAVNGEVHLFGHPTASTFPDPTAWAGVLDYVQEKRRAGDLEVTTATGMTHLPGEADAVNYVPDHDASASNTYSISDYWSFVSGSPSVNTDGGQTGSTYYALSDTGPDRIGFNPLSLGPQWPSVQVEFYAKHDGTTPATITVDVNPNSDLPGFRYDVSDSGTTQTLTNTWKRFYVTFGNHRKEDDMFVFFDADEGTVHLDNIKIYPV